MGAEFGHMPLTGGDAPCMCGASGCWGMEVGANALLRHLGLAYGGGRGRAQAARLLTQAAAVEAGTADGRAAVEAVEANARALGRGIAALVNAHDPEVVILSGLAADLYDRVAPVLTRAVEDGLMTIRRDRPPLIAPSAMPWRGSLLGAMESVFDAFLTPEGLATWLSARS
jgi:predicted NBD/HSP70 family sugar kinase